MGHKQRLVMESLGTPTFNVQHSDKQRNLLRIVKKKRRWTYHRSSPGTGSAEKVSRLKNETRSLIFAS
jgi:hypothetical protein